MFTYIKKFKIKKELTITPFDEITKSVKKINVTNIVLSGTFQIIICLAAVFLLIAGLYTIFTGEIIQTPELPYYTIQTWTADMHPKANITLQRLSYGKDNNAIAVKGSESYVISVLAGNAPSTVYFLEYVHNSDMTGFEMFKQMLEKKLDDNGIKLKVIGIKDLEEMGADTVVVMPTGNPPIELSKGIRWNVIFIGNDMQNYIDSRSRIISSEPALVQTENIRTPTTGLKLALSDYKVMNAKYFYNVVSISDFETGQLITIPSRFSSWNNIEDAVDDTVKIIKEHIWTRKVSASTTVENRSSFGPEFKSTEPNFLITKDNQVILSGRTISCNYDTIETVEERIFPKGIIKNEREIQFNIILNSPHEDETYRYEIFDSMDRKIYENVIQLKLGQETVKLSIDNNFQAGDYKLKLLRKEHGREIITAEHGFHVVSPIMDITASYDTNDYKIKTTCDRDCVKFRYDTVKIYVDNSPASGFGAKDDLLSYTDPIELKLYLGKGQHNITLDFGNNVIVSSMVNVPAKGIEEYMTPEYLIGFVILIIIVAVGIKLRRKDKIVYNLDIPDFAPVARVKVPVKKSMIISLFNQINKDYGWHYLPITTEELQSALFRISYKGRHLNVSEHNIERILDQLVAEKHVKFYDKYFGLTVWEQETGTSIKNFALLRKIRDMFINNVVRFENFAKKTEYDTKIYLGGNEYYVLLFKEHPEQTILKTVGPLKDRDIIIIFENNMIKKQFINSLYSHDKEVLIFKLELKSERIKLMTFDEFEAFLKKFKKK